MRISYFFLLLKKIIMLSEKSFIEVIYFIPQLQIKFLSKRIQLHKYMWDCYSLKHNAHWIIINSLWCSTGYGGQSGGVIFVLYRNSKTLQLFTLKMFYFISEYSWLTLLCQFQVYKVVHVCVIYSFSNSFLI